MQVDAMPTAGRHAGVRPPGAIDQDIFNVLGCHVIHRYAPRFRLRRTWLAFGPSLAARGQRLIERGQYLPDRMADKRNGGTMAHPFPSWPFFPFLHSEPTVL